VPAAIPGCYLPAIDMTIGSRTMRGEPSNGMICSKSELGIKEDVDQHWIWLLASDLQIDESMKGLPLAQAFPWLDNIVIDIDNKTITNRPDLTGLMGVGLELYTQYMMHDQSVIRFHTIDTVKDTYTPLTVAQYYAHATPYTGHILSVQTSLCAVYHLIRLDNIRVQPSDFYTRL
jgi:hypothetical protein